jgi:acetyl esterase/lipase
MFKTNLFISAVLLALGSVASAQEVIDLTSGKKITTRITDDQQQEIKDEKTGNRTVYNVNMPSITIFKPTSEKSNGIAILVCPGGAFHILDIDNEGYNVAKILSGKGYTAMVLKYRLVPLDARNPFGAMQELAKDFTALERKMAKVIPSSIEDTKTAFRYIKDNAPALGINANKVGILGFSAGGTLSAALGYEADTKYRPAFFAPIYPYLSPFDKTVVPAKAAPMFIAVAEDDDFGFDSNSLKLYQKWKGAGALAELHIYAKGRHGFGTKKQNLPVDSWMERFLEWLNFLEKDQRSNG